MKTPALRPFLRPLAFLPVFLVCAILPSPRATAEPAATRTFRILSLVGSRLDLNYEPSRNQPTVSISLSQAVSSAYAAPADGRLEFFRELPPPPDAPPGTKPTRQVLLATRFPADASRCLIALQPAGPGRSDPLIARVLPDDAGQHPAGTMRIINLSHFQTAVKLGDDTYVFAPDENRLAPLAKGKLRVSVQTAVQTGGSWQSVARTARRVEQNVRGFMSSPREEIPLSLMARR